MRGAFSGAFGKKFQGKAASWAAETPNLGSLPEHIMKKKTKDSIVKKLTKNR